MLEDGPGRFDDRILVILLEQVDRPLVREQRALLDEPEPGAAGMADDLENIGNALDRAAVHELFERESVLARAGEQRDDLSALLPVMKSRAGDAAFMERARTGDRPGPFFARRLSHIVGEAEASILQVEQLQPTSSL